jgi:hypothetical protein
MKEKSDFLKGIKAILAVFGNPIEIIDKYEK